jgi:hypothetical protein
MKLPSFLKRKSKKDKIQEEVQKEFDNGNIILLDNKEDYEDFEGFKEKTSELDNIKDKIELICKNGK